MRKQFLIIAAILLTAVSACVLLFATPVYQGKTAKTVPECSKTCECKPAPQTGFFIFDSFSGNL
jgi:hypothetical protein